MEVPNTLKKLLEPYPKETQLQFREAIEKLHLQNPDDPIFELMLVLGLWGTYYREISGQIVENGQEIKKQNAAALKSLDERVRMLQGLAQIIQQGTDQLSSAGAEIVEKLPVNEIAHQVIERINKTIKSLPIEKLEKTLHSTNAEMSKVAQTVATAAENLDVVSRKVVAAAQRVNETGLPWFTFVFASFWMVIGACITAFLKIMGWIWR